MHPDYSFRSDPPTGHESAGRRLNHCRDSGASGYGPAQGGSRRGRSNYATCPTCGKRIQITRDGRLRAHGTRREGETR